MKDCWVGIPDRSAAPCAENDENAEPSDEDPCPRDPITEVRGATPSSDSWLVPPNDAYCAKI